MDLADDLHALRLERKWWRHVGNVLRATECTLRIAALERQPPPPPGTPVTYANAGVASVGMARV